MTLRDRVAIVTGGGTGQGRAIATVFAAHGVQVVLASLTREKANLGPGEITSLLSNAELEGVARGLAGSSGKTLAVPVDVTAPADVQEMVQRSLAAFDRIDILVNAAGIALEMAVVDHDDRMWQKVLNVNLTGTYRCTKAVLPTMIKNRWGRVINISSTAGQVGGANSSAYCASKHGVIGFTRSLALEVAEHGITANAICPTWVGSGMGRDWIERQARAEGKRYEEKLREVEQANPQKRILEPEEVAHLAAYLASDEARGVNGADITISGGALW